MYRILTNKQMRDADLYTIEKLNIPKEVLVERAAQSILEFVTEQFKGGRFLVCVGKGNNGADGIKFSELLSKIHGYSVVIFYVENPDWSLFEKQYDVVVDCLFGTGLNRIVEGDYFKTIQLINQTKAIKISCDIPSGINGDNGLVMGCAVKSDYTVVIQDYKLGHFLNDAKDYCGKLILKDIGISVWGDGHARALTNKEVKSYFVNRNYNVHKGLFGKVCVIGGSKKYSGSVMLSTSAICALKMGVGYVNLAIPNSLYNIYAGKFAEITYTCLDDDDGNVVFNSDNLLDVLAYDSICIGMGMGVSLQVYNIVCYLLENFKGKLIIDADGLNSLAKYGVGVLKNKKCSVVITPHVKEFERLSNNTVSDILKNPVILSQSFAKEYGITVLLKSSSSIITDGFSTFVNYTGCAGMSKGGSGDLLSGLCAGVCAKQDNLVEAVAVSAYLFGKAGEFAQGLQNEFTVTPSDVVKVLPSIINSITE